MCVCVCVGGVLAPLPTGVALAFFGTFFFLEISSLRDSLETSFSLVVVVLLLLWDEFHDSD